MPWDPLPSNRETDPHRVGESLDRLVRHLGAPSADAVGGVFGRWAEIVGEQVAAHTEPLALREGTLTIAVTDPAWATQLAFLEAEILERVRREAGVEGVARVQVRVRRAPA